MYNLQRSTKPPSSFKRQGQVCVCVCVRRYEVAIIKELSIHTFSNDFVVCACKQQRENYTCIKI